MIQKIEASGLSETSIYDNQQMNAEICTQEYKNLFTLSTCE